MYIATTTSIKQRTGIQASMTSTRESRADVGVSCNGVSLIGATTKRGPKPGVKPIIHQNRDFDPDTSETDKLRQAIHHDGGPKPAPNRFKVNDAADAASTACRLSTLDNIRNVNDKPDLGLVRNLDEVREQQSNSTGTAGWNDEVTLSHRVYQYRTQHITQKQRTKVSGP